MQYGLDEKADAFCARLTGAKSIRCCAGIHRTDPSCGECAFCFTDARGFMAYRAGRNIDCVQYFESLNACFVEAHACIVENRETGRMSQRQMRRADSAVRTCHDDLTAHFVGHCADAVDDERSHSQSMSFS